MGSQGTILTISDEDRVWLENYSRSYGISMAEAIRRGIARLKSESRDSIYQMIVRETRGIWQGGDGLEYQEKARSEWR